MSDRRLPGFRTLATDEDQVRTIFSPPVDRPAIAPAAPPMIPAAVRKGTTDPRRTGRLIAFPIALVVGGITAGILSMDGWLPAERTTNRTTPSVATVPTTASTMTRSAPGAGRPAATMSATARSSSPVSDAADADAPRAPSTSRLATRRDRPVAPQPAPSTRRASIAEPRQAATLEPDTLRRNRQETIDEVRFLRLR